MRISDAADIHIGVQNTNIQEIMMCFDDMIAYSDMIVISGDILNSKNQTSSDNVTMLLDLFDYITPPIAAANKKMRVIYGTHGHDAYPQLQILNPYATRMDLKIISRVTEEKCGNTSLLYIPEEIIQDKHEYYKDTLYSGKKYDYIFGHGVITEGFPMPKGVSSSTKIRTTPKFGVEELRAAVKYYALFGHYHRQWFDGNVGYVGSLSRFRHGEPEDKGWWLMDGKKLEFHKNEWCPDYTEEIIKCADYSIEDLHSYISTKLSVWKQNMKDRDRIKFTCYINRLSPEAASYTEIVRSLCRGDGISYTIKDNTITVANDDEELVNKYDYIFDRSIPMKDKITKFNETEFEGDLDVELLDHYLSRVKKIEGA